VGTLSRRDLRIAACRTAGVPYSDCRLFGARRHQLGSAATVVPSAAHSARTRRARFCSALHRSRRRAARLVRDGEDAAAGGISPVGAPRGVSSLVDLGATSGVGNPWPRRILQLAPCFPPARRWNAPWYRAVDAGAAVYSFARNQSADTVIEIGTYRPPPPRRMSGRSLRPMAAARCPRLGSVSAAPSGTVDESSRT